MSWRNDLQTSKSLNKGRLALLVGSVSVLAVGAAYLQDAVMSWLGTLKVRPQAEQLDTGHDLPPMRLVDAPMEWMADGNNYSLDDRLALAELHAKIDLLAVRMLAMDERLKALEGQSPQVTQEFLKNVPFALPPELQKQFGLDNNGGTVGTPDGTTRFVEPVLPPGFDPANPSGTPGDPQVTIVDRNRVNGVDPSDPNARNATDPSSQDRQLARNVSLGGGSGGGRGRNGDPSPTDLAMEAPSAFEARLEGDGNQGSYRISSATLATGQTLGAILVGGVNSETPGLVKAVVSSDPSGRIPAGAVLIGNYDGRGLRFSAERLPITFTEIQINKRAFAITAYAADPQGRSGVAGEVDRQLPELLGLAALNIVSGAAVSVTAKGDGFSDALAFESVREGARNTRALARETFSTSPTIDIAPGTSITVIFAEPFRAPSLQ